MATAKNKTVQFFCLTRTTRYLLTFLKQPLWFMKSCPTVPVSSNGSVIMFFTTES